MAIVAGTTWWRAQLLQNHFVGQGRLVACDGFRTRLGRQRVRSLELAKNDSVLPARRILQLALDSDLDADWQELAARPQECARRTGALVECHADPLFFAPDNVTGPVEPVCGEHQREMFGDANRAADVQGRPDIRYIASHTIDSAAAKLDRCGLQHAVPCGGPFLRHEAGYLKGLKN
jgi:hypothetical protein